ncbi:hypothetical protein K491DRAFT_694490 [Lophiostoma macrostomum CBS 122681]|uniref:Cora-domain-containing protein n=1 Tax=Lophiostoma macrostomum CBS 122681 TaxID=1314788 RepID=A0A6A6T2V4_9PLEO|nr:hypothetical protein K491DRAFT_694490 [Lophiostoma macrostomum CBS 122681]
MLNLSQSRKRLKTQTFPTASFPPRFYSPGFGCRLSSSFVCSSSRTDTPKLHWRANKYYLGYRQGSGGWVRRRGCGMTGTNGAANGSSEKRSVAKTKKARVAPPDPREDQTEKFVGSWLCEKGPYQEYLEALSASNPSLKKPDPANKNNPLKPGNAKVVLLESPAVGQPIFSRRVFESPTGPQDLRSHFAGINTTEAKRRIYIMEGLAQDYVAVMGGHFFMDPSFFQRQERTCVWSNDFTPTSDALPQPSLLDPQKSFHLQYCELRQFSKALDNKPFFCKRTGRHVGMTASRTQDGPRGSTTGILRRKIGWWSRETTNTGWDVVILCDPQLSELKPNPVPYPQIFNNTAFQDGYVDFVPPPGPEKARIMPRHPHDSMLEDMCHYLEHRSDLIDEADWAQPFSSTIFLKKIVAAHYLQLIDYIKAMLPSLELRLTTAWVDEQDQWRNLQTISRRCGNYSDDIEDTLLSLGYPIEALEFKSYHNWKDCSKDFQYIYFRLRILKQRADTLMQAMTGLASIAGNRQNLEEAKRVKRLNLLALLYIPLAYTSSLFSMQDQFSPGNPKFWIYWIAALLSVAVTFAATWILNSALDDAAQWTLGPLKYLKFWDTEKKSEPSLKRAKTIFS